MQIRCLGGFREVGRNAVLLQAKKEDMMLDFGMKVETGEIPKYPGEVDSILLAHAHLDHSGAVPVLYRNEKPKTYSTAVTFEQVWLLLKDSMKIAKMKGFEKHYDESHIKIFKQNVSKVTYGQQFDTKSAVVEAYDAGHVPGSIIYVVEVDGKRILYTSDFKLEKTKLLNGAKIDKIKDIDVAIMESTYASREHPDRRETERKLFDYVNKTVLNDGIALIPVFAVGRAAEILMVLDEYKADFPIYLDGMAKQATEILLKYPEFIRDPKALRKALYDVKHVNDDDKRRKISKEPCAIVTTGGMMEGGPIIRYMKYLYNNPQSSIIFTGYQSPKTAGRYLLDTGRFVNEEIDLKVKMRILNLDFSAHAGRSDLFNFVQKINPGKIVCMHGDNCERFAKELKSRGFDAIAPRIGDVLEV